VAERPAVNASPLIFLASVDMIDLLQVVAGEVIVPRPVAHEIEEAGPDDLAVKAIQRTAWLLVRDPPSTPAVIQSWGLGDGESSVLAWVHKYPGTEAIIDDLAARRCAATLGIPVRGTLGLVLIAKQRGKINSARVVIEQLRISGMYLSDRVMNQALALVGE